MTTAHRTKPATPSSLRVATWGQFKLSRRGQFGSSFPEFPHRRLVGGSVDRGVRLLVVSEAEYEQHLAELEERGQTGQIEAPLRGAYSQTPLNEAESDR